MQEAESLPDENADFRMGTDQTGTDQEEEPVSRIVIEFGGLGKADVVRADFENISLGQMMVFARYVEWQCQNAIRQYERDRQAEAERRAKLQQIVVPGMGLVQ